MRAGLEGAEQALGMGDTAAGILDADHDALAFRASGDSKGARGLIALSPIELPVMQAPAPAAAPKPVGMSLPMA